MNNDERDIRIVLAVAVIATAFILGICFGKATAIHNCYMVTENTDSYVLNFNGTEHLYLKQANLLDGKEMIPMRK